jgi:hypothetical protein
MLTNPITSLFGLIAVLCPIISSFFPDLKAICDNVTTEAIGLGLITAADGVKRPALAAVKPILLAIGLAFTLTGLVSACTQLKALLPTERVKAIVAEHGSGRYQVSVTKDGVTLWQQTVECTSDGTQLTGCHAVNP